MEPHVSETRLPHGRCCLTDDHDRSRRLPAIDRLLAVSTAHTEPIPTNRGVLDSDGFPVNGH